MSYDISLTDPVTGETLRLDAPHHMHGGTNAVDGTTEAHLNVTWNYAKHYYRAFTLGGIRSIYGLTGAESIPVLQSAIDQLGDDVHPNYWEPTEGNAKRALTQLLALAKMRPDGVWNGIDMTDNTQPEALRLAEQYDYGDPVAHSNTWKVAVCTELRRPHSENETLRVERERNLNSIRVCNEIINKKNAELESLTTGYAAARLEIESLQARIKTMAEEHADELMVAHLDGRMRGRSTEPALPEITEEDRAIRALVGVEQAKRQYYYKVDGCPAENSESPDCICWHDEGTGPCATDDSTLVLWRDKADALVMRAAQPAGAQQPDTAYAELPSYEHQRAIMEAERNASLDEYSRIVPLTSTESMIYERAFTNGWNRHASHGQAPAQAAPQQGGVCDKAPAGWLCTRQHGHEGPCAAEPTLSARSDEWVEGYAAGVRDGWKDALRTQQAAPTPQEDGQPAPVPDWLPFSKRMQIADRHGVKVTAEFNALVRDVIQTYLETHADRASSAQADSATTPTNSPLFTTPDADLNELLESAYYLHGPRANMDDGLLFLAALEKVMTRLIPPAQTADSVLEGAVLLKEARDALWQPANVALCERIDAYLDAARKKGANHD